jgi:hypothetical protein
MTCSETALRQNRIESKRWRQGMRCLLIDPFLRPKENRSAKERFEVDSANAAREFLNYAPVLAVADIGACHRNRPVKGDLHAWVRPIHLSG